MARCNSSGGALSGGSSLSRLASIAGPTASKKERSSVFIFRLKGYSTCLARFVLQENLHTPLRLLEPGVTKARQLDSLFKKLECGIQGKLARLEFPYNFFEPL